MGDLKHWNEPNLSPTDAKRQHYVPQVLLRSFALKGKIRVFDLEEQKEYKTSTINTAVENRFYDETTGNTQLSTENWLSQLEGAAAPLIDRLKQEPDSILSLSTTEELIIARFLGALRFRTPAFRQSNDNVSKSMLQQIKDLAKKQLYHQHDKKKADSIWADIKTKPDHWWFNESEAQQPAAVSNHMLAEVQGYANLLRAAPWRIGCAPDSISLYTSDNPVAGYLRSVHPWWETGAFDSLIFLIPLSPKMLLKIERRPDEEDDKEKLNPRGERYRNDFSTWEISFARHMITAEATRYLYGEGPMIMKTNAVNSLRRIGQAQYDCAIRYCGFNPEPPKSTISHL